MRAPFQARGPLGSTRRGVRPPPAVDAANLALSSSTINGADWISRHVSNVASDWPDATYTILNSNSVSVTQDRVCLESPPGDPGDVIAFRVRASRPNGEVAERDFTLTCVDAFPAGAVADFEFGSPGRLWQDAAGTVPVTAAGQPVGRVVDAVSGWLFEQPTAASRPTYGAATSAMPAGLDFDGTDDFMDAVSAPLTGFLSGGWSGDKFTVFVMATLADTNGRGVLCWGTASAMHLLLTTGSDGAAQWYAATGNGGGTANSPFTGAGETPGTPSVFSLCCDAGRPQPRLLMCRNGSSLTGVYRMPANQPALTSTICRLGARTQTPGTGRFKGRVHRIVLFADTAVAGGRMRHVHRRIAVGSTVAVAPEPPLLDLSQHRLWWQEHFDSADVINPTQATDRNPTGLIPTYTGTEIRNAFGSSGALGDEVGWMVDYRGPGMAAFKRWAIEDGVLTIDAVPRSAAFDAAIGDTSLVPADNTWLTAAFVSNGYRQRAFGYVGWRVQSSGADDGPFPAGWLMPAGAAWPGEIDAFEHFTATDGTWRKVTSDHTDPYFPAVGGSTGKTQVNTAASVDSCDEDFHEQGVLWLPGGDQYSVFDGRILGKVPYINGARAVDLVSSNVSGGLAGVSDGKVRVNGSGGSSACALDLVMVGGAVTAVELLKSGAGFAGQPTWTLANGSALPAGVVLDADVGPDLAAPHQFNEPMYALGNLAMGSLGGPPNAGSAARYRLRWDAIRWFAPKLPTPAVLTLGTNPAFDSAVDSQVAAIKARAVALGGSMTTAREGLYAALVREMRAFELRMDRVPQGGREELDWDATKLSLMAGTGGLYLIGADPATSRVNLANPGVGDLTVVGAPGFTPDRCWSFTGATNQYLESGLTAAQVQFNPYDSRFEFFLRTAPTNAGAKAPMLGFDSAAFFAGSTAGFNQRLATVNDPASFLTTDRPLVPGHHVATRGWRKHQDLFVDGEAAWGGYTIQRPKQAVAGTFRVGNRGGGGANAIFELSEAAVGRRFVQPETEAQAVIVRKFLAALGAATPLVFSTSPPAGGASGTGSANSGLPANQG